MNPATESPSTALNMFTRRSFLKTTALTVGAVAILSQGKALAANGSNLDTIKLTSFPSDKKWWRTTFFRDDGIDKLLLSVQCESLCSPKKQPGTLSDTFEGAFNLHAAVYSGRCAPSPNETLDNTRTVAQTDEGLFNYPNLVQGLSCSAQIQFQVTKADNKPDGTKQIMLSFPYTNETGHATGTVFGTDFKLALQAEPKPDPGIHASGVAPLAKFEAIVGWIKGKLGVNFKVNWAVGGLPGLEISVINPEQVAVNTPESGSVSSSFIRV